MADLMTALRNAHNAGDEDAAKRIAEMIKANEPSLLDKAAGVAEVGLSMAGGAAGDVLGGASGVIAAINPFDGGQEGGDQVKFVQNLMTYNPRTKEGQEYLQAIGGNELVQGVANAMKKAEQYSGDVGYATGEALGIEGAGPVLGGAYSAIPAAIGEVVGAGIPSAVGKTLSRQAGSMDNSANAVQGQIDELSKPIGAGVDRSTDAGIQEVADVLAEKKPDLARIADFDPEVLRAADELGFTELPPAVAANNAQLRDVAMGMASMSGSVSKAQYGDFIESLGRKADDLIKQGGGEIDKGVISNRFNDETTRMIDSLDLVENDIYANIKDVVTPSKLVEVDELRSHLASKAAEFGAFERMPKPYLDLMDVAFEKDGAKYLPRNPTYAEFDLKRKEIGQSLNKKIGPYADSEVGMLSHLYGAMKEQQRSIMKKNGVSDLQDAADAVTIKKKAIQNAKTDLMGKNLSDDLMPKVATRIKGLPSGNVKRFTETMDKIPRDLRQAAAVSALNDLMKGTGSAQKDLGVAKFGGFFEELNRSPTAKAALYKYLPKETQRAFENMGTLSKAVHRANREVIKTGAISQFFPDNRGFANKLMDAGIGLVAAKTAGPAAGFAVDSMREFLTNTTPKSRVANDLVASKEFQDAMRASVRDGVVQGGAIADLARKKQKILENSKQYKDWVETLSGESAAKLASIGIMGYLMTPDDEAAPTNEN